MERINFLATDLTADEYDLKKNLLRYEQSIADIKRRQDILHKSIESSSNGTRLDTPPPRPPSMSFDAEFMTAAPSTSSAAFNNTQYGMKRPLPGMTVAAGAASGAVASAAVGQKNDPPAKFSFQIKRAVKVDKFGLVRIASPLATNSPSPLRRTRSIGRSRSRSLRSRSRSRRKHSRSPSRSRRRGRRSRSSSSSYESRRRRGGRRSSSRSLSRSRSKSRHRQSRHTRRRRRTPSPFVPRNTPPPPRRRRSRTPDSNSRRRADSRSPRRCRGGGGSSGGGGGGSASKFGNRVWQRPGYTDPPSSSSGAAPSGSGSGSTTATTVAATGSGGSSNDRWQQDKYDDPSIEEIDAIINRAQKQRKDEIIKRDKDILKKPKSDH